MFHQINNLLTLQIQYGIQQLAPRRLVAHLEAFLHDIGRKLLEGQVEYVLAHDFDALRFLVADGVSQDVLDDLVVVLVFRQVADVGDDFGVYDVFDLGVWHAFD